MARHTQVTDIYFKRSSREKKKRSKDKSVTKVILPRSHLDQVLEERADRELEVWDEEG